MFSCFHSTSWFQLRKHILLAYFYTQHPCSNTKLYKQDLCILSAVAEHSGSSSVLVIVNRPFRLPGTRERGADRQFYPTHFFSLIPFYPASQPLLSSLFHFMNISFLQGLDDSYQWSTVRQN